MAEVKQVHEVCLRLLTADAAECCHRASLGVVGHREHWRAWSIGSLGQRTFDLLHELAKLLPLAGRRGCLPIEIHAGQHWELLEEIHDRARKLPPGLLGA